MSLMCVSTARVSEEGFEFPPCPCILDSIPEVISSTFIDGCALEGFDDGGVRVKAKKNAVLLC